MCALGGNRTRIGGFGTLYYIRLTTRALRNSCGGYRSRTCASREGERFSKPSPWTTRPTLLTCVPEWGRTTNLWIRNPMLYPLSYKRKKLMNYYQQWYCILFIQTYQLLRLFLKRKIFSKPVTRAFNECFSYNFSIRKIANNYVSYMISG